MASDRTRAPRVTEQRRAEVESMPRSRREGTTLNMVEGGFRITRDGTDARVACMNCSMIEHLSDDQVAIDEVKSRHAWRHPSATPVVEGDQG